MNSQQQQQQKLYEHLAKRNASVNLGYDDGGGGGDDSDSSEQPVNYSLKYQDTAPTMYPEPSLMGLVDMHPSSSSSSSALQGVSAGSAQGVGGGHSVVAANAPMAPRAHSASASGSARLANPQAVGQYHNRHHPGSVLVNNYVAPAGVGSGGGGGGGGGLVLGVGHAVVPANVVVHNRFPASHHGYAPPPPPHSQHHHQQQHQQQRAAATFEGHHKVGGSQGGQYCAYAETDLDSMDEQPTDFSLRYAEDHSDDQVRERERERESVCVCVCVCVCVLSLIHISEPTRR